jgi:hypothetical protein
MSNSEEFPQAAGTARSTRFRQAVLEAAHRFKSGWFDLAAVLVQVRTENLFVDWGYDSFESYCAKELHIRRQTALKLTRSYSFLEKHERKRMADKSAGLRAPAFEVVEVLAQAEKRGQLSSDQYRDIRDAIWDPNRAPGDLKRELTARFPRPTGDSFHGLARFAHTARRLANELRASARVPRALSDHAAALAAELEALVASDQER